MVGRRDRGHVGHRGGRHGDYGGQPASSFQNAVTVLHLETKLKLYNYTNSLPVAARCWFEPARLTLSTRRKRPSMAALAEALPRACAVPRRALCNPTPAIPHLGAHPTLEMNAPLACGGAQRLGHEAVHCGAGAVQPRPSRARAARDWRGPSAALAFFVARSLDTSLARCQPTEAQATGKSPRAEHPVMPGVSSVHPEVRRLLPHWQAFSIDERPGCAGTPLSRSSKEYGKRTRWLLVVLLDRLPLPRPSRPSSSAAAQARRRAAVVPASMRWDSTRDRWDLPQSFCLSRAKGVLIKLRTTRYVDSTQSHRPGDIFHRPKPSLPFPNRALTCPVAHCRWPSLP